MENKFLTYFYFKKVRKIKIR